MPTVYHTASIFFKPNVMTLPLFRLAFLPIAAMLAVTPAQADNTKTMNKWCDDLGGRLRSVSAEKCRAQDFVLAKERTAEGRSLVWRDIPPSVGKANKAPRVLVIGGIHGDELTSVSIVFRWLEWLGEGSARKYFWRMIPASNPDGLLIRPSTRVNSRGVDLNRNFPTPDWDSDAHKYWVERTRRDPRRNPGEAANSEIETQWLVKQIEEFRPDVIISVHAPYNLLDYDGPAPQPLRFGRLALHRLGVYPGSLGNYGGLFLNIPVVTIELPFAGTMPSARDQKTMWNDMLKWMDKHIQAGDGKLNPANKDKRPTEYGQPTFKPGIDHRNID